MTSEITLKKTIKEDYNSKIDKLNEDLAEQKKNLSIKTSEYSNKLSNANKLVEQYRKTAKTAVNKYIESQAIRLGIKSEDIIQKLPKNYSFADIDSICESLSDYKLNISNLPFNLESSKIVINESKSIANKTKDPLADEVDDSLLKLAKLD